MQVLVQTCPYVSVDFNSFHSYQLPPYQSNLYLHPANNRGIPQFHTSAPQLYPVPTSNGRMSDSMFHRIAALEILVSMTTPTPLRCQC